MNCTITVTRYKHQDGEQHRIVLEVLTGSESMADSSYRILEHVAMDMRKTLKDVDPLLELLDRLNDLMEKDGD